MDNCNKIKAHIRMEEKYERLSLSFDGNQSLKEEIFHAIETVKKETGLNPMIIDKIAEHDPKIQSVSIECTEENCRDCGVFFSKVLHELQIDKCEDDI